MNNQENEKHQWNCFKGHVRKGCVMECRVNGEVVQKTEIAKMIWKVALLTFLPADGSQGISNNPASDKISTNLSHLSHTAQCAVWTVT